jgi:hypothetical protein
LINNTAKLRHIFDIIARNIIYVHDYSTRKKKCQSAFGMIYVFMDFVYQRNGIGFL